MPLENAVPLESLTEKSDIRTILDSIWKATETMINEYQRDGRIGEVIPNNSTAAWEYARHEALRIAREKTGRELPEN